MPAQRWSTEQLAEFVAALAAAETEASAAVIAVERAAEALDAEIAAIVCGGELTAAVGYPEGCAPVAELELVTPGARGGELAVPGMGTCPAAAAALAHPRGGALVRAVIDELREISRGVHPAIRIGIGIGIGEGRRGCAPAAGPRK